MRLLHRVALLGLAATAGVASADGGLTVDATGGYWFGAQTKLRLQAVPIQVQPLRLGYEAEAALANRAPLSASVIGDYYFSTQIVQPGQPRSGFRASGALWIRQSGVSLSDLASASRSTASFGVPARPSLSSLSPSLSEPANYSVSTLPYVGLGYSEMSVKTGWGYWADVGLVVQNPGNAGGLGRVLSGSQSMDDLLRDLRMSPMLQLGVNYAF